MTCVEAEEYLLEALDEPLPAPVRHTLDTHLSACAACARFAAGIRLVDAQLVEALPPLTPPPGLEARIRRDVRQQRVSALNESLPDIIHLGGCAVVTLLSAALLPVDLSVALGAGVTLTGLSYAGLAIMRWSLEAATQPDS